MLIQWLKPYLERGEKRVLSPHVASSFPSPREVGGVDAANPPMASVLQPRGLLIPSEISSPASPGNASIVELSFGTALLESPR